MGPRFYDISHMHDAEVTRRMLDSCRNHTLQAEYGEIFWVNNSSVPDRDTFAKLASGLSNDKVSFKGFTKSGIAELMAVHHRKAKDAASPLITAMIGIGADYLIGAQRIHPQYSQGASNLLKIVVETFEQRSI